MANMARVSSSLPGNTTAIYRSLSSVDYNISNGCLFSQKKAIFWLLMSYNKL